MAMMRRLGSLADLLLRHHLGQQDAEYRSELTRQRQEELSKQNFAQTVLSKVTSDPAFAARLKASGQSHVADMPIDSFLPGTEQVVGKMSAEIGEKPEQFDPLTIISRFNAEPGAPQGPEARAPIERLIQQRLSGLESRRLNAPKQSVSEMLPSGQSQTRFINPQMQDEPIVTGLSAAQEGVNELEKWKQNEGNAGRIATEINTAGRTAGAQAAARHPYDLAMERRRHLDQIERAKIEREAEVHKLPPAVAEKVAGVDTSLYSLDKLEALYNTQGVDEQIGPLEGAARRLGQKIPLLPTDPEFNTFLAETTTLQNSIIKAITGAQMSEPEAKRIMGQVPTEKDKPEVWEAKALATRQNLIMLRNKQLELVNSVQPQLEVPTELEKPEMVLSPAAEKLRRLRLGASGTAAPMRSH